MDITIVDDENIFYNLRSEWNNLLTRSNSNTIFLTWEWLYNWWCEYKDASKQLYIIIVRKNNKLIGIAPLYIEREKKIISSKTIHFLGSNVVCSDYLDFIIDTQEDEALIKILSSLQKQKIWDILNFSDIPSSSKNCQKIEGYFKNYSLKIQNSYTVCPYIDLRADWESIYESYESFLRNTIKRKTKKINKLIDAEYIETRSEKDVEKFFMEFLKMNVSRLKEKKIHSPFLKKDFQSFHLAVLKELYSKGMAKLILLQIENKVIAGIYILIYNNSYHYYQSGFYPSAGKLSPGTLLLHRSIKEAFDNGADEFDFLQGNESYKEQWTKLKRINSLIKIYNNTAKGRMLASAESLIQIIKSRIYKPVIKYKNNWIDLPKIFLNR